MAGWPWAAFPPRAPTDPHVDTLDHTVPQVAPSLRHWHNAAANPSFAIRWHCGNIIREFKASQVFPANGVVTRCLASHPPGPCGLSSPDSSVLSRHCDFLPSIPPRFVSFTWRYHESTHLSLPSPLRGAASGLGLVTRYPRPGILRGNVRISQVPGEPQFPFAHVLRPRPVGVPDRLQDACMALAMMTTKAPTTTTLSRLNSMAFGLAAYVSRLGYPSPRKAGFQVLVRLSWAGFHPQGSDKRFLNLLHVGYSSSSKLLGTTSPCCKKCIQSRRAHEAVRIPKRKNPPQWATEGFPARARRCCKFRASNSVSSTSKLTESSTDRKPQR